jgi:hypothetical protein
LKQAASYAPSLSSSDPLPVPDQPALLRLLLPLPDFSSCYLREEDGILRQGLLITHQNTLCTAGELSFTAVCCFPKARLDVAYMLFKVHHSLSLLNGWLEARGHPSFQRHNPQPFLPSGSLTALQEKTSEDTSNSSDWYLGSLFSP